MPSLRSRNENYAIARVLKSTTAPSVEGYGWTVASWRRSSRASRGRTHVVESGTTMTIMTTTTRVPAIATVVLNTDRDATTITDRTAHIEVTTVLITASTSVKAS